MVRVRVPATTANLGPGYDVLGLALELHNFVEMEKSDKLSIQIEGTGTDSLPKDESNIAYQAAQLALRELKI
ncbi:homoserine kinase, partial [bacterium]|nr:homoserine kinase [bacterium]